MKIPLSFGLAVLFVLGFLSTYAALDWAYDLGRSLPAPVIETQPVPKIWTRGTTDLEGLWCEVSSMSPERHWCDYVQQRAAAALEIFCADAQHAVQCEGI